MSIASPGFQSSQPHVFFSKKSCESSILFLLVYKYFVLSFISILDEAYLCISVQFFTGWSCLIPHSHFSVIVMAKPRTSFSLYFQSTLDDAVDYVPVLSAPCFLVEKILWESSKVVPVLFIHCYYAIAHKIPVSFGQCATPTTILKHHLRNANRLSLETVLKPNREILTSIGEKRK